MRCREFGLTHSLTHSLLFLHWMDGLQPAFGSQEGMVSCFSTLWMDCSLPLAHKKHGDLLLNACFHSQSPCVPCRASQRTLDQQPLPAAEVAALEQVLEQYRLLLQAFQATQASKACMQVCRGARADPSPVRSAVERWLKRHCLIAVVRHSSEGTRLN